MNPASFCNRTLRNSPCKLATLLAATLMCAVPASRVVAQVAVTDQASISSNQHGFAAQLAKTIDQLDQQMQQYALQVRQYEQMLTKIENLGTNFQLQPNTLHEIDADPLIQARCSSGSGGNAIGNLLDNATSLLSQSIVQSQRHICAAIVAAEVNKYNLTVQMLDRLYADSIAIRKLDGVVNGISNLGQSSSATSQALDIGNQMSAQMSHWSAQLKAADAVIGALKDMQSTLAQTAMNARPDLQGEAVQAAALAAAFDYRPLL